MEENQETVDGATASQIVLDIGNRVAPEDSKMEYGEKELAFRDLVEKQFAEYRKQYPNAILDVKE